LSSNSVNLEWIADPNADLTNFQISEGTSASNLTPLITIGATIPGAALYNYLHAGIDQTFVHYYAISAIDSCGQGHLITTSHTIVLSGITTTQNYNHLSWNKFEMDSAIVLYYDIYRTIDAGSKVYLGSVNDTIFDFYDDIKSFYATQGDICYQIIANYKFKSSLLPSIYFSNSNTWCSTPFSSIYLPNAVFPKGNNKIFKPLITFPNFSNYKLEIYNRWGERIFTSLDYNVGWDGTANGKDAIEGNYTYTVSFSKQDGKEFVKQGNVSVIY
jgi:gliding motility-associated-like protein